MLFLHYIFKKNDNKKSKILLNTYLGPIPLLTRNDSLSFNYENVIRGYHCTSKYGARFLANVCLVGNNQVTELTRMQSLWYAYTVVVEKKFMRLKTFQKWFHLSLSIYPHFYVELEVTGKRVNREGGYCLEILARSEKATQCLETGLTKMKEQLKESINYYLKQNISLLWKNGFVIPSIRSVCYREVSSKRRCQSGPQKSVHSTEVSGIMYPLYRSFSMRVWLLFHLYTNPNLTII